MRYVIEGEWSGYHSGQRRIVHREVYQSYRKVSPFIESIRAIHAIGYDDGTSLFLTVREAKKREKVQLIHSYSELIRDAVHLGFMGFVTVDQIEKLKQERRSSHAASAL